MSGSKLTFHFFRKWNPSKYVQIYITLVNATCQHLFFKSLSSGHSSQQCFADNYTYPNGQSPVQIPPWKTVNSFTYPNQAHLHVDLHPVHISIWPRLWSYFLLNPLRWRQLPSSYLSERLKCSYWFHLLCFTEVHSREQFQSLVWQSIMNRIIAPICSPSERWAIFILNKK